MILSFVKQKLPAELASRNEPQLHYVSLVPVHESVHPRVMHRHEDFLEIILIREGAGTFSINGRDVAVSAGDLVIYNSTIIHDERTGPDKPLSWFCVAIKHVQWPGLRPNCLIRDGISPVFPSGELFAAFNHLCELMFDQLVQERPGHAVATHHLVQALLAMTRQLILQAEGHGDLGSENEPLAHRVITYLDNHFTEAISLEQLAGLFKVSTYYLAHVFKERFGYSPLQYVSRHRIGEAQSLLISTDLSITEIASRVGYDSPSHFNRQFRKYVGMPPRRYKINYFKRFPEHQSKNDQ